jgi:hypothetical protein
LKAQCALKILNRLLPQYPTIFNVAKFLVKHLQTLVDNKNKIDQKLWALALGCKNNLEKKALTMADRPPDAVLAPEPVQTTAPQGGAGEQESTKKTKKSASNEKDASSSTQATPSQNP